MGEEKICICGSRRVYFRKWTKEFVCYKCGKVWLEEEEQRQKEKMSFVLDKMTRERGEYMTQPRYLQINESAKVYAEGSDKSIMDDIMKILNEHGRFSVVRNSLIFTVMENKDWKEKEVAGVTVKPITTAPDKPKPIPNTGTPPQPQPHNTGTPLPPQPVVTSTSEPKAITEGS